MARPDYTTAFAWGAYERLRRLVAFLISGTNEDGSQVLWPVEIISSSIQGGSSIIQTGQIVERGGTLTTGGASQLIANSNDFRYYFFFQNLSSGDLWLRFGGTAALAQPSIKVPAGGTFQFGTFVSHDIINVTGATTGQAWAALEGVPL